jgi:hypothetical protein
VVFAVSTSARAQERFVDDAQVLAAKRVWLSAGVGVARFTHESLDVVAGTGLDIEEALGLGYNLEFGARFGARLDDGGRGLRADDSARNLYGETLGTGQSIVANPDFRLRWQLVRCNWLQASLEERLVVPIKPDPYTTEILAALLSVHLAHTLRVDVRFEGATIVRSLQGGYVAESALGIPIWAWVNATSQLYFGASATLQRFGGTRYTQPYSKDSLGLALGYRMASCDIINGIFLLDVTNNDWGARIGNGLSFSCRM